MNGVVHYAVPQKPDHHTSDQPARDVERDPPPCREEKHDPEDRESDPRRRSDVGSGRCVMDGMHSGKDGQSMQHITVQEILKQSPDGTTRHKCSQPFEALRPVGAYGSNNGQYADYRSVNHEVSVIGRFGKLHLLSTSNNVRRSSKQRLSDAYQ